MEALTKTNDYFSRLETDGDDGTEYIDHWDTGELLFLASAVLRSDRNWVSVTRSIKPFGEKTRPSDWYSPKNCALQYTRLLSEIDEETKKKTVPRTERETSEVMLVKNLTEKRLKELEILNQQTKVASNILKTYIEMVESGDFDEHVGDLLQHLDDQEKQEEHNYNDYLAKRENLTATKRLNQRRVSKGKAISARTIDTKKKIPTYNENSPTDSYVAGIIKSIKREVESDEDYVPPSKSQLKPDTPMTLNALLDSKVTNPSSVAPTSPLLTSLLRNIASSAPSSHVLTSPIKESPRPTPASSPLLNSLLKNSPSSTTIQMSPSKDASPKAVSSPQPFFSPTHALATAAAQQLAVATSKPTTHFYIQSGELGKVATSPSSSACKSAPTLSKLLEMPPSTPGRLPPLPVLDPPSTKMESPIKTQPIAESKRPTPTESVLQRSLTSYSQADKRASESSEEKFFVDKKDLFDTAMLENLEIIQAACDSFNSIEIKTEVSKDDLVKGSPAVTDTDSTEDKSHDQLIDEVLETIELESPIDPMKTSFDFIVSPTGSEGKSIDATEAGSSKKFYKSRHSSKSDGSPEKLDSTTALLSPVKRTLQIMKCEPASPAITSPVETTAPVSFEDDSPGSKQDSDCQSPASKKPRLFGVPVDKAELSEDDVAATPTNNRRSGRRGRKGRGRNLKSTPSKLTDPKDQYEFSESMEENSVGYQEAHTLCYMPRLKDEDIKVESEEIVSSTTEKKVTTPTRSKQCRNTTPQQPASFPSDDEKMSETSDEASNHQLSEDKLKKWDETCEQKAQSAKDSDSVKRTWKGIEIPKKKTSPKKSKNNTPVKKERKLSTAEMEDTSRDSEEVSKIIEKGGMDVSIDMEVETTNDSNRSSSDKPTEDGDSVKQEPKPEPTFGKQDWVHTATPKTPSQSSDDSDCESDASDNQSVSTNKSASQSTSNQSRSRRKERETPEYKAWKKAISIVLREASCHKNANIFAQKVTNDVAPGYLSVVHRPMDLSLMKRNIDGGVVRTTEEFHRDMLLMFQNALMYNNLNHDVHKMARDMQADVIQQITAFINTQEPDNTDVVSEPPVFASLRASRKSQKGTKGVKKEEPE